MAEERLIIRECIRAACVKHPQWHTMPNCENAIINMERSCFNETIRWAQVSSIESSFGNTLFSNYYSSLAYKVISNLDMDSAVGSDHLLSNIIATTVRPRDVATMTAVEMTPSASRAEREEIETRQRQRVDDTPCDIYKCPKCGDKKSKLQEHQTRSADEAATISAVCMTCSHMWRI